MKKVWVHSRDCLLPIGVLSADYGGKWFVLYDHYENEETSEFVEIWLPAAFRGSIAGDCA